MDPRFRGDDTNYLNLRSVYETFEISIDRNHRAGLLDQ